MESETDKLLTAEEAARIIYDTPKPTEQQVAKIRVKLAKGSLKRAGSSAWTTSVQAVAEYLAAKAARQHATSGQAVPWRKPEPTDRPSAAVGQQRLNGFYGELVQDYFLAVAMRRRAHNRSAGFQHAVVIGQLLGLALILGTLFVCGMRGAQGLVVPERAAVERYLSTQHKQFTVTRWFPVESSDEPGEKRLRAFYTYQAASRKQIETDRIFTIRDGLVVDAAQVD